MNKAIQYALLAIAIVIVVYALMKSGLLNQDYTGEGAKTTLDGLRMMKQGSAVPASP
jgi:hypothetical protein